VERYGAEHLDEWAGAYVDDDPNVGVIARFTGNLAVHEAQLRTILNPNARFFCSNCPLEQAPADFVVRANCA
jgi:hypothetical protein